MCQQTCGKKRSKKALEEAVAAEMPEIRRSIKQDLRAYYEPIIEVQIRKEHNIDAESEVVRRAVGKVVAFSPLDESDAGRK
jgi:hypothetical protein